MVASKRAVLLLFILPSRQLQPLVLSRVIVQVLPKLVSRESDEFL
jgi:hypothetical protein